MMQDLLDLIPHIVFWGLVLFECNSKNVVEDGKLFHLGFNLKIKPLTIFMFGSYIQNLW